MNVPGKPALNRWNRKWTPWAIAIVSFAAGSLTTARLTHLKHDEIVMRPTGFSPMK